MEKKVDGFDKELKKLRVHIDNNTQALNERMDKSDGRELEVDIESGVTKKKIEQLERDRQTLQDSVTYQQAQSMRNNLIFGNIEEEPNERPEKNRGDNPKVYV